MANDNHGFCGMMPKSSATNCILVVIDKFTKYGHFIPLCHPYTAAIIAKLFLDNVYKLHGMPLSIVSHRDRIFTSKFWQELFNLPQVQLHMSSAFIHNQMVKLEVFCTWLSIQVVVVSTLGRILV
jgi:hypothetical protein